MGGKSRRLLRSSAHASSGIHPPPPNNPNPHPTCPPGRASAPGSRNPPGGAPPAAAGSPPPARTRGSPGRRRRRRRWPRPPCRRPPARARRTPAAAARVVGAGVGGWECVAGREGHIHMRMCPLAMRDRRPHPMMHTHPHPPPSPTCVPGTPATRAHLRDLEEQRGVAVTVVVRPLPRRRAEILGGREGEAGQLPGACGSRGEGGGGMERAGSSPLRRRGRSGAARKLSAPAAAAAGPPRAPACVMRTLAGHTFLWTSPASACRKCRVSLSWSRPCLISSSAGEGGPCMRVCWGSASAVLALDGVARRRPMA